MPSRSFSVSRGPVYQLLTLELEPSLTGASLFGGRKVVGRCWAVDLALAEKQIRRKVDLSRVSESGVG